MHAVAEDPPAVAAAPAERLLDALAGGGVIDGRRVAAVVAHPDDEAIGLGAQLARLPGVTVIHATDGAPRDPQVAAEHGFASPAAYASARALELERVMMLAGVPIADRFCLGLPDQGAALKLCRLARALVRLFAERATQVVLTHAYEGGHPDHDAMAFAVHAARRLMAGEQAIAVIEMPFYRDDGQGWALQEFAPARTRDVAVLLPEPAARLKREMYAAHKTQGATLQRFGTAIERFRAAPDYAFGTLPNGGALLYERYPWGMTGARWVELARDAAATLGVEELV